MAASEPASQGYTQTVVRTVLILSMPTCLTPQDEATPLKETQVATTAAGLIKEQEALLPADGSRGDIVNPLSAMLEGKVRSILTPTASFPTSLLSLNLGLRDVRTFTIHMFSATKLSHQADIGSMLELRRER